MLFDDAKQGRKPLSERVRPRVLEDLIGYPGLTAKGGILRQIIEKDLRIPLILWGPPGVGKTSVGHIIAAEKKVPFLEFSTATTPPKQIIDNITALSAAGKVPVVVINEFHRYNKLQQELFLPLMESGNYFFVLTTTENPSFTFKGSILSRSRIIPMEPLSEEAILEILKKSFEKDPVLKSYSERVSDEALVAIAEMARGDARFALNALEAVVEESEDLVTPPVVHQVLSRKPFHYDRSGDERYILISAFIKSIRGSDPDAALYYLARMLEEGEDPLYIARRMIIAAAEDIGLADPNALSVAVAAYSAFEKVGLPEGWIPLAEATVYLSTAPKSNAAYKAYLKAREDVHKHPHLTVPLKLRNPSTPLLERLGYGRDYVYPHNLPDGYSPEHYLPEELKGRIYYRPTGRGYEKYIEKVLSRLRKLRNMD